MRRQARRRLRDVRVDRRRVHQLLQTVFKRQPMFGVVPVLRQAVRAKFHHRRNDLDGYAVTLRQRERPVGGTSCFGAVDRRHGGTRHRKEPSDTVREEVGEGDCGRARVHRPEVGRKRDNRVHRIATAEGRVKGGQQSR